MLWVMERGGWGGMGVGWGEGGMGDELKDFSGLHVRNPYAAFAMLLFMLSLGGIPPTSGFMGKFWLFNAAIDSGYYGLAVIGVLNSAVSLYYYIRVVVFMYLKQETTGSEPSTSVGLALALAAAVAVTIVLGVYPELLFQVAAASARTLRFRETSAPQANFFTRDAILPAEPR